MSDSPEIDLEALFARASRHAEKVCQPLGELSLAILNASINCRDSIKPVIRQLSDRAPLEQEAYIFYEYLYLFIDIAIREAIGSLTSEMLHETQSYVTHLLSSVAVGMYFDHWADEKKERIREQFVDALNERAEEFAENLRAAENELEVLNNFVMTAREVCLLAGQDENWAYMKEPMITKISQEWMHAGFANHLAGVFAAYTA